MVEMGPKILHRFRVTHVEAHVMTPGLIMEVVLVRRGEWICIPVQGEEKKERKKEDPTYQTMKLMKNIKSNHIHAWLRGKW